MLVDRSGKPVVSVVVPAYRSEATMSSCLQALMLQDTDLPYEVIVVESSGNGTGQVIIERYPGVQLVGSKERLFAGAARNRGAEAASGQLLFFIDSDCIAEPAWLSKMWRIHQEWDCSAVGGSILNANPEKPVSISSYMNEFSDFFPIGGPRYVDYLPGGNISYKMDIFKKYGGFDAGEPAYEDLIFNKQLFQAGEKLLFDPGIRVAHKHRSTLREYLPHEFRRGRGGVAARRKGLLVGASLVRYPVLAFLAAPAVFMRRSTVFPYRMLRAYPSESVRLLRALPYFHTGLLAWYCGFFSGIIRPETDGMVSP